MQHQELPNHATHDVTLIAGHAAGDLVDSERTRAQFLLDSCRSCAELDGDLIAIAAATRSLPALATAPRDFRLSPEQAASLQRGSWLRAALAPFSATRSAVRPMATAFTSLGLAGLLVATVLPGLLGSPASLSGPERNRAATGAEATSAPAAPVIGPGQPVPAAQSGAPGDEFGVKDNDAATNAPEAAFGGGTSTGSTAGQSDGTGRDYETTPPNPLLIGSLALLAVGLLLFGLRFAGRRLSV